MPCGGYLPQAVRREVVAADAADAGWRELAGIEPGAHVEVTKGLRIPRTVLSTRQCTSLIHKFRNYFRLVIENRLRYHQSSS